MWLKVFNTLDGYIVLLCPLPGYYDVYIKDYSINLIVSGYPHVGHIGDFNKGLWTKGQGWFPKYTAGLSDGKLLVSRGIRISYKVPRINNKPKIIER